MKLIGQESIAVSIITCGELIYGAFNKKELNQIGKDLANLIVIEINKNISDIFLELMRNYSLSHNLAIPDALIAATAIERGIPLYTLNTNDFKFISGLELHKK